MRFKDKLSFIAFQIIFRFKAYHQIIKPKLQIRTESKTELEGWQERYQGQNFYHKFRQKNVEDIVCGKKVAPENHQNWCDGSNGDEDESPNPRCEGPDDGQVLRHLSMQCLIRLCISCQGSFFQRFKYDCCTTSLGARTTKQALRRQSLSWRDFVDKYLSIWQGLVISII